MEGVKSGLKNIRLRQADEAHIRVVFFSHDNVLHVTAAPVIEESGPLAHCQMAPISEIICYQLTILVLP